MGNLLRYLECFSAWLKATLWVAFVEALELIFTALSIFGTAMLAVLPSWPEDPPTIPPGFAAALNWFIPMGWLMGYLSGFVAAWIIYRVIRAVWEKTRGVVQPTLFE